ncbi:hypothetical protein GW17_00031058 [Ensete ventricosum]|nr:hypothetical protein GW17_00031058 [Ensete ventricosum]
MASWVSLSPPRSSRASPSWPPLQRAWTQEVAIASGLDYVRSPLQVARPWVAALVGGLAMGGYPLLTAFAANYSKNAYNSSM